MGQADVDSGAAGRGGPQVVHFRALALRGLTVVRAWGDFGSRPQPGPPASIHWIWPFSYSSFGFSISDLIGVMLVPVLLCGCRRLQESRGDLLAWIVWIFCDFEGMGTMAEEAFRRDQVLATTETGPQPQLVPLQFVEKYL